MSTKIGRNEPCPCGSGKKYKRCCLNDSTITIERNISRIDSEGMPHMSRLAVMRFGQELIDNPDVLEKTSKHLEKFGKNESFKEFILHSWTLKKVKAMSTSEIITKLRSMNIDFDTENFKKQAQDYHSAIQLSEDNYYTQEIHANKGDEDFIWLSIIELWNRLIPEKSSIEMIDILMQDGYEEIKKNNYCNCIEKWNKAWELIQKIVPSHCTSVEEADEIILDLTQSIHNWCQDFEMESGNAGTEDDSFYKMRINYTNDFCRIFPDSDELIMHNMMRAEAESYAALGEKELADNKFHEIIKKFPKNAWGYIGWGDMYCDSGTRSRIPVDYDKAEEIYRSGLTLCDDELDAIHERLEYLKKNKG